MRREFSLFKVFSMIVLSLVLLLGIVGCGSEESSSSSENGQDQTSNNSKGEDTSTEESNSGPKKGGILKMARYADASNFDPIIPTDNMSIWVILNIYDQLTRVAPDGKSIEPGLAEEWKVSDDGKTYTFNLRKGVKFHNGAPVTAQDVKFSLDRVMSDESNWSWLFGLVESVEITGDHEITMNLEKPYAPLLSSLALFGASIVPEAVVKENGADYLTTNPVGSGPFSLEDWKRGQKIVLKKNPEYWQEGKPYLDGVEIMPVPEDNTRLLKLQAGEIDIAGRIPFNSIQQLEENPAIDMHVDPIAQVDMININTTREPFNDLKIRQAMNYAVDNQLIIDSVLFGHGSPSGSFLPPMKHFNSNLLYEKDLEKAKQLIEESSKPNGFKTTLKVGAGDQIAQQIAVIVKEQLAQIDIEVEIIQLDEGIKREQIANMDYDLSKQLLVSDVIDPDELTIFGVVSTGGINSYYTGYENKGVNELARNAQLEQDEEKRKDMYYEIQKTVHNEAPFIFLYYPPSTSATQNYVEGFKVLTTGSYRLEDVWLNK